MITTAFEPHSQLHSLPALQSMERKYRDWHSAVQRNDVMGPNSRLRPLRFAIATPAYPELTQVMCGLATFG